MSNPSVNIDWSDILENVNHSLMTSDNEEAAGTRTTKSDLWSDILDDVKDSFLTSDNEDAAVTPTTKSVSWACRKDASIGISLEDNLPTGNSSRVLPLDSSTGGRTSEIFTEADKKMLHPESSYEQGEDKDLQPMLLARDSELDELEGENDLPFDSFSMLYAAKSFKECCLPVAVFGLQMLILVLIMINLLQTSDRPLATIMNVPVDVPLTVKISQYVACLVSVFTADDLISGALHVGRRVVKKNIMQGVRLMTNSQQKSQRMSQLRRAISEANHTSKRQWKWELSNSMRILEGALVIVVSFIFIVQSSNAIDLWLNFAGVQFVGMLDDTAYHLAQNRFLGSMARHLALRVSDFEVYQEGEKHKLKLQRTRFALFLGICLAMWAGLSVFVYHQAQLTYACSSITVTVGESTNQDARHFSGRYVIQGKKINGRAVYVQEQGNGAFLAFCADNDINRWTISPLNNNELPWDPCKKIMLESERTKTHDVSELRDSFSFWTGEIGAADVKCNQCHPNRNGDDCSFQGNCNAETNLCSCDPGFFGDACQYRGPCTELVAHDEFHGFYDRGFQKNWDLLYLYGSPVMVYDRPVYIQNIGDDNFDVIMFDGGRWLVSESNTFLDWYDTCSGIEIAEKSFAKYLTGSFNARHSECTASYISTEHSTLASPSNIPFSAWLAHASEENLGIGTLGEEEYEFLCADCNDGETGISSCVNAWGETDHSLCKSTEHDIHGNVNRCECLPGFGGPLCRLHPVEGTASLHLHHASGICSTCYEDNPWVVWDIGKNVQCYSMGKLFFQDGNVAFSRELGLHLNETHFSVFVSSTEDKLDTLCHVKEGSKEVYTIRRDEADERINVNAAIHLNNQKESLGQVVKPNDVKCLSSTEVYHDVCSTSLTQVYSTTDTQSSLLQHAWLLLDLKITPSQHSSDTVALDQNNTSPASSLHTSSSNESTPAASSPAHVQNLTMLSHNEESNIFSASLEQFIFAVIPKTVTNAFFLPVKDGCEGRAAALSRQSVSGGISVKCLFIGPSAWNVTEQIETAKNLIRDRSVDGIAMSVIDEDLSAEVVDMAVSADIPFITFDSDAPSTKRAAYVGTDNVALGEEMGMLLLSRFASSGLYAILSGDSPNLAQRGKGIHNVLKENNWREVKGSPLMRNDDIFDQMRNLMNRHSDLTAILSTFGGVMREEEGEKWKSFVQEYPDLILLSADSMPIQIDLLNGGYVDGLVGQQPADMGSKSIDTLLSLSKGNEVEDYITTSLVVMGRVNKGTPYTQLELSSASSGSATRPFLVTILALLALIAALMKNKFYI